MPAPAVIDLDQNATTAPLPEVRRAVAEALERITGNSSSIHRGADAAREAIHEARQRLASLLQASAEGLVFTSGGTESDFLAIVGAALARPERRRLVVTAVEHPAVREPARTLQRLGLTTQVVAVDASGRLDLEALRAAVTPDVAVVSAMWANNETGVIFPIEEIGRIAHQAGALYHSDAVQAVGKLGIALDAMPVDLLSLSAHKLHGPKGVGALWVRPGSAWVSPIPGGGQQAGRRGGTENAPGIIGLGVAAQAAQTFLAAGGASAWTALRDRLEAGALALYPEAIIQGAGQPRLPNTTNIAFTNLFGESILLGLDRLGVRVSTGAACKAGHEDGSPVLRAMGKGAAEVAGSIRFSLGSTSTRQDIDEALGRLGQVLERLTRLSAVLPIPAAL